MLIQRDTYFHAPHGRLKVREERHLFRWEEVRIHLDDVEGLGNFIEFEAVVPDGSDLSRANAHVATMRQAFAIDGSNVIGGSYCDLALAEDGRSEG